MSLVRFRIKTPFDRLRFQTFLTLISHPRNIVMRIYRSCFLTLRLEHYIPSFAGSGTLKAYQPASCLHLKSTGEAKNHEQVATDRQRHQDNGVLSLINNQRIRPDKYRESY